MARGGIGQWVVMAAVAGFLLAWPGGVRGQIIFPQPVVGGVAINADGVISHQVKDGSNQLAQMRQRLKDVDAAGAPRELKCVSLPKVFAQAREFLAAGKPLPEDLKYLGGLTQVQYVFVYPEQKDLLIAGPAEEWTGADTLEPVGKSTGRPVLQFFDLVAAMRTVGEIQGRGSFFGCSIDPPKNVQQISDDIAEKYGSRPAGEIVQTLTKAVGPQKVTIIGTADNTRLALALVAADYQLKRFTMGLEITPVTGMGNAIDSRDAGACRFWFEPLYEPLVVSADGNAYGITGPRLQVKAGARSFDTKGVTGKAKSFTELFNKKLPELVKVEPALADLQNIADLALVAALVRHDQLDRRVGWDTAWCQDEHTCPVPTVPAPKTAETLAAIQGNTVVSGGVAFSMNPYIGQEARTAAKDGALPAAPAAPAEQAWQTRLVLPAPAGNKP